MGAISDRRKDLLTTSLRRHPHLPRRYQIRVRNLCHQPDSLPSCLLLRLRQKREQYWCASRFPTSSRNGVNDTGGPVNPM